MCHTEDKQSRVVCQWAWWTWATNIWNCSFIVKNIIVLTCHDSEIKYYFYLLFLNHRCLTYDIYNNICPRKLDILIFIFNIIIISAFQKWYSMGFYCYSSCRCSFQFLFTGKPKIFHNTNRRVFDFNNYSISILILYYYCYLEFRKYSLTKKNY